MKKILAILFSLASVTGFSQTTRILNGQYSDGVFGKKIPDTVRTLVATSPLSIVSGGASLVDTLKQSGGSSWSITGNSGTSSLTNFLGTTDDMDVVFKRNNVLGGLIDSNAATYGKTLFGYGAGFNNAAVPSTAFGFKAMNSNTSGNFNSAFGNYALKSVTTGNSNSAFGYYALGLSTGSSNSAFGSLALGLTASGSNNSVIGAGAMQNYTGSNNAVIGASSLINGSGSNNTALGEESMSHSTVTGNNNVSIGRYSGYNNSSGANNINIGYGSGAGTTTQSNNVFISSIRGNTTPYQDAQNNSIFYGQQNLTTTSQYSDINGRLAINSVAPTSFLQLSRGVSEANGSPLKFTSPVSLTSTSASGTGTIATLNFSSTTNPPFVVGTYITVSGVTPSAYNGTWQVSGCSDVSVQFYCTATGSQTVAGTITQGSILTTPEAGAVEYDGTSYYVTDGTGTRYKLTRTLTGTAAPVTAPTSVGDEFVDTVNKKIYFATGTSSSADWTITN